MTRYMIEQTQTGVVLFDGEATDAQNARDLMARDAGYHDYADLMKQTGPEEGGPTMGALAIYPVAPGRITLIDLHQAMHKYSQAVMYGSECNAWQDFVRNCYEQLGHAPWRDDGGLVPQEFGEYWSAVANGASPDYDADTGEAHRMTSRLLRDAGEVLYGPRRWQSEIARELNVSNRTVRRWIAGDADLPPGVDVDLWRLCEERAAALDAVIGRLNLAATP